MTDIAPVRGLIELQDNFTSQLGLAEAALSNFSKQNQESLKAVAVSAALVTGAISAIAVATIELGKRGADVNDVNSTLQHFAGGAGQAKAAMDALRDGTKGTVDNFVLAKDAAMLLSAGVKLTAADFATLGEAAFVLQNRGFKGTKEQLDLVSEALVTGRTRTLARELGVIDAGDAEENYAKKLGISKDMLSEAGKVEAKRIQVMAMLQSAVKDAGAQERDFGEEIEFAKTKLSNWIDDLGSAIASSKAFTAGFKAVETAVSAAFGDSEAKSIETVVGFLVSGTIALLDFAQGAITLARIVETSFLAVKTSILGVTTGLLQQLSSISDEMTILALLGAKMHLVSPETVATLITTSTQLNAMTVDLTKQTVEAGKSVIAHTEFDKTLDTLSDGLQTVRDSMVKASRETENSGAAAEKASGSAGKLAGSLKELNAASIDQAKVQAALTKSSTELAAIWDDYFAQVAKSSGTSAQAQRAEIEKTFNKQVEALDALDPLYNAKYNAYRITADQALKSIGSNWDQVRDKSINALDETAKKERQTYEDMIHSSLHFTREALDEQLQKTREAEDAARGMGAAYVKAHQDAADAAEKQKKKLEEVEAAARAAAAAARAASVSFTVNAGNLTSVAQSMGLSGDAAKYAKEGFSFQEIVDAMQGGYTPRNPKGPRIPGFKEGGLVDIKVGEDGPETVRIPLGSMVLPSGHSDSVSGSVTNHIYINDTLQNIARKVSDEIMKTLQQSKQFSAAR